MRIYEEYYKRHSIGVPFVKHTSLGFLFIRENNGMADNVGNLTILYNRWNESSSHPGHYIVKWVKPIHNSYCSFFDLADSFRLSTVRLEWDEFEKYWYDLAREFKEYNKETNHSRILSNEKEIVLAAWEFFVYSHDEHFATKYKQNAVFSNLLFQTLDFTSSIDSRYMSYLALMKIVQSSYRSSTLFQYWNSDLKCMLSEYSNWFLELAKNDR